MCLYPNKRWHVGYHDSGKPKFKITGRFVDFLADDGSGNLIPCSYDHPELWPGRIAHKMVDGLITPCGQCLECRIQRSREWANRLMIERDRHETAYFITLTYDEAHVPYVNIADEDTGEILYDPVFGYEARNLSLYKPDVAAFLKRLRSSLAYKGLNQIRFYACGEYGSETARPHYHLIVFGLDLPDLKLFKTNFRGEKYYRSKIVEDCWRDKSKNPIGHVLIADCTWETCAYVARYVVKKFTGELSAEYYDKRGIQPEFSTMSRKPGIARDFYDAHKHDIYEHDEINISTGKRGILTKPPAYYDRLYDQEAPEHLHRIKERRQATADARAQLVAAATPGYTDEQRLEIRRMVLRGKNRQLKRSTL